MTRRALLSVSDKTGLVPLAKNLAGLGFELVASGGTARTLREGGLTVTDVSAMTGSPEVLGGRVKTLHPAVHAGILSRRTAADAAELAAQNIAAIDVVVCNLYPFHRAPSIEQIDIGGVTLLRAAAKNYAHVSVASDPADYDGLVKALTAGDATLSAFNATGAAKAFAMTARYDLAIGGWLRACPKET
ncbi:MAG: phosphoribosylaminoimidazolecarboxamide formyltransferase/IMP cyclohydrolase, partial [Myxococcota bacterium]